MGIPAVCRVGFHDILTSEHGAITHFLGWITTSVDRTNVYRGPEHDPVDDADVRSRSERRQVVAGRGYPCPHMRSEKD